MSIDMQLLQKQIDAIPEIMEYVEDGAMFTNYRNRENRAQRADELQDLLSGMAQFMTFFKELNTESGNLIQTAHPDDEDYACAYIDNGSTRRPWR
jgi:hypothetical protein